MSLRLVLLWDLMSRQTQKLKLGVSYEIGMISVLTKLFQTKTRETHI